MVLDPFSQHIDLDFIHGSAHYLFIIDILVEQIGLIDHVGIFGLLTLVC